TKIDPITAEVVKNTLGSIADEMALVILRTAYSPIVRDSMDYSTGVADHNGEIVGQGLTVPLHIGSFPLAMSHLLEDYGDDMHEGDVFVWNDPYGGGGMHLPDVYIVKPLFYRGRREAFMITLCHQADIGGISAGGNSVLAIDNFQEGLRIPIVKMYDRGEPVEQVFKVIAKNNRYPTKVAGDMRAQLAACRTGEKSYLELIEKLGADTVREYTEYLHEHAERVMREEIRQIPNGVYEFEDHIDGLGENPEPIKFQVKVTVQDEEIEFDWTGSSPQVPGAINCPVSFTHSSGVLAVRCLVSGDVPNVAGATRPIKHVTPLGTIINPSHPAPSNARAVSGYRMIDTIFGALSQALPDRVKAGGDGGVIFPAIASNTDDGEPYVCTECLAGAWGAMHDRDGPVGLPNPGANMTNQPIEMIEALFPVEVVNYRIMENSGGPGKFRGAPGFERTYRLRGGERALLTQRSDRRRHLPYGLEGGYPGTPALNTVRPARDKRKDVLPTMPMERIYLDVGDVFQIKSAGGGGHGDPLERDPQLVLKDVVEEYLTEGYARRVYGVVLDPANETVDERETQKLRSELRAGRAGAEGPDMTYMDLYLEQHFDTTEYEMLNERTIMYHTL
ncbi:MAG: hydantoinase B/oxoprolinase family protein, partial [Halothiobacillaceae bacterium]